VQRDIELKLVISENGRREDNRTGKPSGRENGAQQKEDSVFSEPAVKKTLELFDGRVIKVSR